MFKRSPLSIAILASIAALPLHAQATELETVAVEATAEAQTSVTKAAELVTNGNSETGTALRNINGVEGSRMGGHGVDLFIRGQGQSQLNVLLDGAKIEGGCPNRMDPPTAYAELNSYDEIIVTKGVATVTKGSGGTGGTVEFVRNTPVYDPNKMVSGSVSAATSTNGIKHDLTAEVQAVGEKGYIVVQGNTKSADNYEDGNGDEVRSNYESRQGRIDLGWTPNENHELKFSYENTVVDDALFQGAMMDAPKSDGTTTRLQYQGKDLRASTGFIDDVAIDLYQSEVDHVMNNFELRMVMDPTKKMETVTNVKTSGAKIQLTSMIGHTQLDYGIQTEKVEKLASLYNRAAPNPNMVMAYMWPEAESTTNSVFAESTSFFKDNQKVILGLRYDDFSADANLTNSTSSMQNEQGLYQKVYGIGGTENEAQKLNGLIRYEKGLSNNMNTYVALSRTHRYPDATELFIAKTGIDVTGDSIPDGSWAGNPNLKPEEHNQLDFGISQIANHYSWSASAYYDRVNNYILRDLSQNQVATAGMKNTVYLNKDATLYGVDLEGQMKISKFVSIGSQISYLRGTNDTDDRNLSNIAPINGNVFAEYKTNNLMTGARLNFAQQQDTVNTEYGELETAGYGTVDLYGSYAVNKNFSVLAGVDNLFDKGYQTYLNRSDFFSGDIYKLYEPGRIVWARVNAQF